MAGKFEVYMDAKGKYRFRLKAGNGQIIAVGEAYESMAACTGGIDSIRANAPGAALVDLTGSGAHAKPAMKEPGAKHSDMKHSEMKHGEAKRPDMQSSDMRGDGMKQPAPKPGEARQPAAAGTRPGMPASSGPASSKPSMH
jgi:hypothetical protein